jgi:two-component system NtrC family sensor kinase
MTLTGLAMALIPVWLLGVAIYLGFAEMLERDQHDQLEQLAVNRASAVELFLSERIALLEALLQTASLETLPKPGELQSVLAVLNRRQPSFIDLGIIDASGRHLAYVGSYELADRNYGDESWFEETMLRGVYVSDVFLGFRREPHFVIAIRHDEETVPWILRATIDSEVFDRLVQSGQTGRRGDAYIVNRAGFYQTPPRFGGEILGQAPFETSIAPPGLTVVPREGVDGQELLTAFAWIDSKNWLLVIDRDPAEMEGFLGRALQLEFIALILASLLIGGAVIFHTRLLVSQLEREDQSRVATEAQIAHSARLVSLGRMAAGVAHEINNPLAAIGELAGLMEDLIDDEFLEQVSDAETFRGNVRKIQEQVDRTRGITHRMLGFARRMEPHRDTFDPNKVAREALSFLEREAAFRGVELASNLDPDLPLIRSDRSQLQQVFLNLLNNALDAVPEGGRVALESRSVGDEVEFTIQDNGSGIKKSLHDRIFDPFFTTKGPGEGSGLGLSICHTIMKQLGGSISFDSTPGEGTTFQLRLPRGAVS